MVCFYLPGEYSNFFIQPGCVNELDLGIINVNKFSYEYSGKNNSQFIEGTIFNTRLMARLVDVFMAALPFIENKTLHFHNDFNLFGQLFFTNFTKTKHF